MLDANATVLLRSERGRDIAGVPLNRDGARLKGLW